MTIHNFKFHPSSWILEVPIGEFRDILTKKKAHKGVLITTSRFSKEARDTTKQTDRHVVLIDGVRLANLMIRYNVGCRVVDTIHLREVD